MEGGVGLRAFERGQHLTADHWFVTAGTDRGPTVVLHDTDEVRSQLIGAPLASRGRLVRTCSAAAPLVVAVGWSDDDERVRPAALGAVVRRHEAAVQAAVDLRRIVRTLGQPAR